MKLFVSVEEGSVLDDSASNIGRTKMTIKLLVPLRAVITSKKKDGPIYCMVLA